MQYICYFDHLGHKSRLIFGDHVTTSDSGKDTIHHSEFNFTGRHTEPTVSKQYDQSILPQIGRLTTHIWPRDDMDIILSFRTRSGIQFPYTQIIWYKLLIDREKFFYHRMPSTHDRYSCFTCKHRLYITMCIGKQRM